MSYFPNLDEQTRLIMISELDFDLRTGLFYEPKSITATGMFSYKRLLKECFSTGTPETLQQKLLSSYFRKKDSRGKNIPSSIRETLTFSDFNRYYIRAMLVRALSENRKLCVYRAKQVIHERQQSKLLATKVFFEKSEISSLLEICRDYRKLFSPKVQLEILKPNSGLSLKFVGNPM